MKSKVTEEMKKVFRPEFLNRIDETIVFHSLEEKHMQSIVHLMIEQLQERLIDLGLDFSITEKAVEKIAKEDFDIEYVARPFRFSIYDRSLLLQSFQLKVSILNRTA